MSLFGVKEDIHEITAARHRVKRTCDNLLTLIEGPPVLLAVYGWSVALAKFANHPMWALGPDLSAYPMAYL